jgi:hypothetical protein
MRPSARTALFLGFLALQPTRAIGATLFAGSFVDLTVDGPDKKVSLNYPRRGANNLCGVDIKSNVIVLNVSVWQSLANRLDVSESYDGRTKLSVPAIIDSKYSPTLRYVFSRDSEDFATMEFRSKDGSSIAETARQVLGGGEGDVRVIAVSYSCPE